MATTQCRECKTTVPDGAEKCPGCGTLVISKEFTDQELLRKFVVYLIKQRMATRQNLEITLKLQLHMDRRIGNLAVFRHMITPVDVLSIIETQAHGAKEDSLHRWGFLTNHALILIHVTQHPRSTVREIAQAVGLTERATYSTLQDLRDSGIVERQREGNRNSHSLNFEELAAYRREGTAPGLVPSDFVSDLMVALLPLRPAV